MAPVRFRLNSTSIHFLLSHLFEQFRNFKQKKCACFWTISRKPGEKTPTTGTRCLERPEQWMDAPMTTNRNWREKKDLNNMQNNHFCPPSKALMCKQKVIVGINGCKNTPLNGSECQFRKGEHNREAQRPSQYLS